LASAISACRGKYRIYSYKETYSTHHISHTSRSDRKRLYADVEFIASTQVEEPVKREDGGLDLPQLETEVEEVLPDAPVLESVSQRFLQRMERQISASRHLLPKADGVGGYEGEKKSKKEVRTSCRAGCTKKRG
jgi:hypothetical protein